MESSTRAKQLMQTDPLVANLAQIGSLFPEYVSMLALVENRTPPREIPPDSELKMIEGSLQEFRVVQLSTGDRLLCKDSAVYVPKSARENILRTLHLCHHAPGSVIQNTKGRIYWPEMRKQIHQVYTSCVECSLHKISKSRPQMSVVRKICIKISFQIATSRRTFSTSGEEHT